MTVWKVAKIYAKKQVEEKSLNHEYITTHLISSSRGYQTPRPS